MNPTELPSLPGLHHVSAICGDPQRNLDFYVGLLGLRLVKKTVNFDDPGSYHLYYGDAVGSPGTLMTFFAWTQVPPLATAQGRTGANQIASVTFAVPDGSLSFWVDRLADRAVDFEGPKTRHDEVFLAVKDPDGMTVHLVERGPVGGEGDWAGGTVPEAHRIQRVDGIAMIVRDRSATEAFLRERMGFRRLGPKGDVTRLALGEGRAESRLDLVADPEAPSGRMGRGAIHHVAWRAATEQDEARWREALVEAGYGVTDMRDRRYFQSIYFHEPAGVLFEIATDGPGFLVDEEPGELGSSLALPPWLEARRASIRARLPEVVNRHLR